jgi:plasmid stabilization system protein ParE
MRISYHPSARRESLSIVDWYLANTDKKIAERFAYVLAKTQSLIQKYPLVGTILDRGTRQQVLANFPYSIVYRIVENEIQIIAIAHHRRKPNYWYSRIPKS